jgi:hypothetical protein
VVDHCVVLLHPLLQFFLQPSAPSSPPPFALQIFFCLARPFVTVSFVAPPIEALYDTGSEVSCIDESVFHSIPVDLCPPQCTSSPRQQYHSASGNALIVRGVYNLKIALLGCTIEHKLCVTKNYVLITMAVILMMLAENKLAVFLINGSK